MSRINCRNSATASKLRYTDAKRLSQLWQRRRRRTTSPSSDSRVSTTWVSSCEQNGQRIRLPVDRKVACQRGDLCAHRGDVGLVVRVVEHVGDQVGGGARLV